MDLIIKENLLGISVGIISVICMFLVVNYMYISSTKKITEKYVDVLRVTNVKPVILNNNQPCISVVECLLLKFSFKRYRYEKNRYYKTKYAIGYITKRKIKNSKRENISHIKPDGYKKNEINSSTQIYNRCHLIASMLGGLNERCNLITGTRKLNETMIKYENLVFNQVMKEGKPVIYKVTPVYRSKNTLSKGVILEAKSIGDTKFGFNIFIANSQNGVSINYKKGDYTLKK